MGQYRKGIALHGCESLLSGLREFTLQHVKGLMQQGYKRLLATFKIEFVPPQFAEPGEKSTWWGLATAHAGR